MLLRKTEGNNYCGAEPTTNSTAVSTVAGEGGWYRVTVPTAAFDCVQGGGISLAQIDQFDFENTAIRNAVVCIGDITIDR